MENKKRNKVLKVLGLVGLFVLVFGLSYALFRITLTGKKKTRITTANFGLTLTDINGNEETEGIAVDLDNAVPETDEEGLARDGYKFVVTNTGNIPASYELKLNGEGTLGEEYIKYALIQKDYLKKSDNTYYMGGIYSNEAELNSSLNIMEPLTLSTLDNSKLDATTLLPGEKMEYELKLWVKEDATTEQASNKTYEANVVIEGSQAEAYMTGKAGDNANYTLYQDGTMAITGTGGLKSATIDMNTGVVNVYNNFGPVIDVITQYLNSKGYDMRDLSDVQISLTSDEDGTYLGAILSLPGFYVDSSNAENPGPVLNAAFGSDTAQQLVNDLYNIPVHVTRIVIDEGITSLVDAYPATGVFGHYMITLPSTLSGYATNPVILQNIGNTEFGFYKGYGLVIPPAVETIDSNIKFSEYIRYLNVNSGTITSINLNSDRHKVLFIGNDVEEVSANAINVNHDMTINIDNTREFVEENWNSNWLNANGNNVTINYLR